MIISLVFAVMSLIGVICIIKYLKHLLFSRVFYAPRICVGDNIDAEYGQRIKLKASVESVFPIKRIAWMKLSTLSSKPEILASFEFCRSKSYEPHYGDLIIDYATFKDKGFYFVTATNYMGHSSSEPIYMNVLGDPPCVQIAGRKHVPHGEKITIDATVVSKLPILEMTWYKADDDALNKVLKTANHPDNTLHGMKTLVIDGASVCNDGVYFLEASNVIGQSQSNKLKIRVTNAPPHCSMSGQPAVTYKKATTFSGNVKSNLKILSVKWQKVNGGKYEDIDIKLPKYRESSNGVKNPVLFIKNADVSDESEYRLNASNAAGSSQSAPIRLHVTNAPPIVTITGPRTIEYMDNAVLTADLLSNQRIVSFKWRKINGLNVEVIANKPSLSAYCGNLRCYDYKDDEQYDVGAAKFCSKETYTIRKADVDDDGEYELVVENTSGEAISNRIKLRVQNAPPKVELLGTDHIRYKQSATFKGLIKSNQKVTSVKWYKKNEDVVSEVDVSLSKHAGSSTDTDQPKLIVQKSDVSDDGVEYWLEVSNIHGDSRSKHKTMTVSNAPPIVTITGPKKVEYMREAVLCANILSNHSHLSLTWQIVNGSDVKDVKLGSYERDRRSYRLTDRRCYFDDLDFMSHTNARLSKYHRKENYTIHQADMDDDGEYQLVVKTPSGEAVSNRIKVIVDNAPPKIRLQEFDNTRYKHSATFKGVIKSNLPITSVKWCRKKDDTTTEVDLSSTKHAGSSIDSKRSILKVNDADVYDDGVKYWLEVSNKCGESRSQSSTMTVNDAPPVISISRQSPQSVSYRGYWSISASVITTRQPCTIAWQKLENYTETNIDITEIKYRGSSADRHSPKLVINAVAIEDDGVYRLKVFNSFCSATSENVQLIVTNAPPMAVIDGPTTVKCGEVAQFTANIKSNHPITSTRWQKEAGNGWVNKTTTHPGDHIRNNLEQPILTIYNVDEQDEGKYRITVHNRVGSTTSNSIHLKVHKEIDIGNLIKNVAMGGLALAAATFMPSTLRMGATVAAGSYLFNSFFGESEKSGKKSGVPENALEQDHSYSRYKSSEHEYCDEDGKKFECKVCLERNGPVLLDPCGHICCCRNCARRINRCPICRERIKKYINAYIS